MTNTVGINNKLGKRLLAYILLCSIFFSICSTFIQLYASFKDDIAQLEQRFDIIEKSYLPAIATSLWDFNEALVSVQLQGIVDLPDIGFVKIYNDYDYQSQLGNANIETKKFVEYPVIYGENIVGKIEVYADYQDIYHHLYQQAGFILTNEFIKIFLLAFFIVVIVHQLITRHLFHITNYAQQLDTQNLEQELTLKNRRHKSKDELDLLVDAINTMRVNLESEINKLEEAENAMLALNGELEVKVHDRTALLADSNEQLQQTVDDLTMAKDKIVQSEKMASLGQLVAGVAHEVNTPLGICITSITASKEKIDGLQQAVEDGKLTKSYLLEGMRVLDEYQKIIERSLTKSVELIRSFKSVAVEQHSDPLVEINFSKHIKDIVNTVKTMFKRKNYQIELDIDESFSFKTYPSAWNQILTNFLMNSHIHGFDERSEGNIYIGFFQENGFLTLTYKDDGKGIKKDVKHKIFEPFVTTKRGQGGSGLGLNIVFNLVDAKLGGTIESLDSEQGVCFQVKVPMNIAPEKQSQVG